MTETGDGDEEEGDDSLQEKYEILTHSLSPSLSLSVTLSTFSAGGG